jgi:RNA polymerase sigma-70 factor (ECF subfamily)
METLPLKKIDEIQLIRAAREGDEEAFASLYRAYSARVYTLVLRKSGDKGEAEDLTQEVFIRIWSKLGTFKEKSSFSTWLYRLSLNLIMRKTSAIKKYAPLPLTREISDSTSRGVEEIWDLQRALTRLPSRCRSVLILHELMGHKHSEIAEMMNISAGTSKAHLFKAKKILKKELAYE